MPVYEYRCAACGATFARQRSIIEGPTPATELPPCPDCGMSMWRRKYRPPATPKPFQPHFNPSVGQYVHTMSDFRSALSALSDANEARTGHPSRLVPVDPADMRAAAGVTDDGLEATERRLRDTGRQEASTRWL